MMSRVSRHVCCAPLPMTARPGEPARTTAAAAPSAKSAVETTFAAVSLSRRTARVHSSTVTNSTVFPGEASAKRAASASPLTPAAQPSPKTGMRAMSVRKSSRSRRRASRLGVAMPVEDALTTISTSRPVRSAARRAFEAASSKRAVAPSRYASVRSGQPCGSRYHSKGRTPCLCRTPAVAKTFATLSKSPNCSAKTLRAAIATSVCMKTCGGTAVARDKIAGPCVMSLPRNRERSERAPEHASEIRESGINWP